MGRIHGRAVTKGLTNDPVATVLNAGKRLMCNDMWGLGLVTLRSDMNHG